MEYALIKVFTPTIVAFIIGLFIAPIVSYYLYKLKVWKKKTGKGKGYGGGGTPIFDQLHKDRDTNTPRMGGIVIWVSVVLTVFLFQLLAWIWVDSDLARINFFSREQTWIPLFALMVGAGIGFIDDLLVVRGTGKHFSGGLPLWQRISVVLLTSAFIGWWFYSRLEVSSINLIGYGPVELGWGLILFYMFVSICIYMSSVIDGLDGLSGGTFLFIFVAYAGIAAFQLQIDIAALCATIAGGILAFLWFNIPPARFYMTETGIMALTMCLTVIAFMTDQLGGGEGVSVLPIIGLLLTVTVLVNTIQILSKKFIGRKVFLAAPLQHHFEALGWPDYKVTMRYWILGFVFAVTGVVLAIAF